MRQKFCCIRGKIYFLKIYSACSNRGALRRFLRALNHWSRNGSYYNECKFTLPIVLALHILISQIYFMLSDSAVSAVKKQPRQPNFLFSAVYDSRDSRAFVEWWIMPQLFLFLCMWLFLSAASHLTAIYNSRQDRSIWEPSRNFFTYVNLFIYIGK